MRKYQSRLKINVKFHQNPITSSGVSREGGVRCRRPVYRRNFSTLLRIFPVICSWSFVHQSSMFRVVDVLCAVSYTVADDEWMFSSLLWIFSCVSWSTPCSSSFIY